MRLVKKGSVRQIACQDFFLSYGQQDRQEGEFVEAVIVPHLADDSYFQAHKISKRFDQDISSVLVAVWLSMDDKKIKDCRIAFGGMAAIPMRAHHAEALAKGQAPAAISVAALTQALETDFTPLDDMRASAQYRLTVAANSLWRILQSPKDEVPASLAGDAIFQHSPSLFQEKA